MLPLFGVLSWCGDKDGEQKTFVLRPRKSEGISFSRCRFPKSSRWRSWVALGPLWVALGGSLLVSLGPLLDRSWPLFGRQIRSSNAMLLQKRLAREMLKRRRPSQKSRPNSDTQKPRERIPVWCAGAFRQPCCSKPFKKITLRHSLKQGPLATTGRSWVALGASWVALGLLLAALSARKNSFLRRIRCQATNTIDQ